MGGDVEMEEAPPIVRQDDMSVPKLSANMGWSRRNSCEPGSAICEWIGDLPFGRELSDWVIIGEWAKVFTQLTTFLMTTSCGVLSGSAALGITQTFQVNPESTFAWRSFPLARGIRSAQDRVPRKPRRR